MQLSCRLGVIAAVAVCAAGGGARAETVNVAAVGVSFVPADVTIQAGDSVEWTGLSGGSHTVAEVDDGSATTWNGGFHSPGGASTFAHQFDQAGVYYYICEPHVFSGMRGTVTVEQGPIPTMSEWGLVVLTLLVLSAGTVVLRRWQRVTVRA
jgi:plastocyanin